MARKRRPRSNFMRNAARSVGGPVNAASEGMRTEARMAGRNANLRKLLGVWEGGALATLGADTLMRQHSWPEILWGEVPAGNDPTDVFPWLNRPGRRAEVTPPEPPERRPIRMDPGFQAPMPPRPSRRAPARPRPSLVAPTTGMPSAPTYAAPMPQTAANPIGDPELWQWVRDHYAANIERSVYDKLAARDFQVPDPWTSRMPQAGYADFGPGGRVTLGPRTRLAGVRTRPKKANRAVRDGYVDFR